MDILFSNVTVVTMDEAMHVLVSAHVGITGTKISYVGKDAPKEKPEKIIDGTGMVLMPGLINCHTHLAMSLLRGAAEDCGPGQWLDEFVFPRTDRMDARSAKAGVLLGLAECLRFGVTSVSDLYAFPEVTAEAVAEVGMKANIAAPLALFTDESEEFDFERDPQCKKLREDVRKWNGYDDGRIRMECGLQAEYTGNYRLWEPLAAYAAEEGLRIQLHLSETKAEHEDCLDRTGLTQTQLLDCHHLLDVPVTAAGCVALEPEDMALLGKRKATAVYCPVSNMKFGLPVAPVIDMVKNGMNVTLGTDSAASNNNLDLFEEMKAAALAAKVKSGDASAMPAAAVLMMATACGARAQGREAECGMIKVGMDADLCLVDFTAPHLMPTHNVLTSLVYSARGGDVAMTMVRGKILYAAGKFPTIDLGAVVQEMAEYAIDRVFNPTQDQQ